LNDRKVPNNQDLLTKIKEAASSSPAGGAHRADKDAKFGVPRAGALTQFSAVGVVKVDS